MTFLFGLTIATSWPVPQEAVETRGEGFGDAPVGAGPFFVQEWNKGSDITIARNPGYADPDLPYLDAINIDLTYLNGNILFSARDHLDGSYTSLLGTPPGQDRFEGRELWSVALGNANGARQYALPPDQLH